MYYGYKYGELGWEKMKQFDSIEEYQTYIVKHKVPIAMCMNNPLDFRGMAASEICFKPKFVSYSMQKTQMSNSESFNEISQNEK